MGTASATRGPKAASVALGTTDTRFVRNLVKGGAGDGIYIQGSSVGNTLLENDARNNDEIDCADDDGSGDNTWTGNLGAETDGSAVCSLP